MTVKASEKRVKDLMSKDVVAIAPQDSVHEALVLMMENRVSALPVTDARGHCVGMLSASDVVSVAHDLDEEISSLDKLNEVSSQWLLGAMMEHGNDRRRVDELMSSTVASVGPESPLKSAASEMLRHHVHRLPVLDKDARLLGIISTMDILTVFVDGAAN